MKAGLPYVVLQGPHAASRTVLPSAGSGVGDVEATEARQLRGQDVHFAGALEDHRPMVLPGVFSEPVRCALDVLRGQDRVDLSSLPRAQRALEIESLGEAPLPGAAAPAEAEAPAPAVELIFDPLL